MSGITGSFSGRVLVVAFEGWSDAGGAASAAAQWLLAHLGHEELEILSAEEFVDYQMHRPQLVIGDDGKRRLEWPDTRLYGPIERPESSTQAADSAAPGSHSTEHPSEIIRYVSGEPAKDVFVLIGAEPSRRWRAYVQRVIELVESWRIDHIVMLGALFSDAPHSRPIATSLTTDNDELRQKLGLERSDYEGPAGIGSALALAATAAGIDHVSVWASVPHYVHSAPSPKATLALLDQVEELLDVVIPRGDLVEEANEWEANINALAAGDSEMAQYIERLEAARDAFEGPESTGEAIAHEFEKFLRRDRPTASDTDNS